ncbi:hypothetical protein NIES4071_77720 [Calothrix sp. NIES-4071]|nr:hypothetical protein NIES4071_77720 [Calothrix sp. NIES-4071]BAZ62045.1 hypothetical protein NIES4105_77660 [Calothrix sp. NIES-4105]
MTKNPFDQFSKQFFETFLSPYGEVKISEEVPGEPTLIDIYFSPTVKPTKIPKSLGLIRRIASSPCLLEPYRNQPTFDDIESCLNKLFAVRAEYRRDVGHTNEIVSDKKSPKLWIIAPSASDDLLNHYGAQPRRKWVSGIYFCSQGFHTRFISVNKLPKTPDTMWLRLFGRGGVQEEAIDEVLTLEVNDNQRNEALRLLSTWRISIDVIPQPTSEDLEFKMIVSKAYQEWEQATKRQGIEQGQRIVVENLLKARFGTLDPELTNIIPSLLTQPTEEYTRLLLQLSREELINRFS